MRRNFKGEAPREAISRFEVLFSRHPDSIVIEGYGNKHSNGTIAKLMGTPCSSPD